MNERDVVKSANAAIDPEVIRCRQYSGPAAARAKLSCARCREAVVYVMIAEREPRQPVEAGGGLVDETRTRSLQ